MVMVMALMLMECWPVPCHVSSRPSACLVYTRSVPDHVLIHPAMSPWSWLLTDCLWAISLLHLCT
jgi:hypothetical protein